MMAGDLIKLHYSITCDGLVNSSEIDYNAHLKVLT